MGNSGSGHRSVAELRPVSAHGARRLEAATLQVSQGRTAEHSTASGTSLLDLDDDMLVSIGYACLPPPSEFCRTAELRAATRLFAVCTRVQRCLEQGNLREAIRERRAVSEQQVERLLKKVNLPSTDKLQGKTSLNWAFLGIDDSDCRVIASWFEQGVLDGCEGMHLSGSRNYISDDGLATIAAGLAFAPALGYLYLWGGDHTYGEAGCAALAGALSRGTHIHTLAVEGGSKKSELLTATCRKHRIELES